MSASSRADFSSLVYAKPQVKKTSKSAFDSKVDKYSCSIVRLSFWVRHGLLWAYALSPLGPQQAGLIEFVGSVNSVLTLLVAAIVTTVASITFSQMKKKLWLVGTAIILAGVYLVVYALVSVWIPIYLAFLPLTDFWMITLPILGIAVLLDSKNDTI